MENNRDFIKGGLPLSSDDFINPDNVREKKSRLLAALDNISKVHDIKMYSAMTDHSMEANAQAIDNTLTMVGQDLNQPVEASPVENFSEPAPQYNPNEYATEATLGSIFDQLPNAFEQPATENNDSFEPVFDNNSVPTFEANSNDSFDSFNPISMEEGPSPYQVDENEYQSVDYNSFNVESDAREFEHNEFYQPEQAPQSEEYPQQPQYENGSTPEYVVDDSKVGKRAGGKGKGSMNGDAKKGRFVAWMAYIVFFIPLLFAGKNSFVRHHANEGLCINILDALGIALYFVSQKITHELESVRMAILACGLLGIGILCLTLFSRVILIIGALLGKKSEAPLFGKVTFIKQ